MRDAIREYLGYTEKEKVDLWKHATFVFDTNVYLNLYRYTAKTREILLASFDNFHERLWMPNHVAREFMKNRCKIIIVTNNQYETMQSKANDFFDLCKERLHLESDDEEYIEIQNQFKNWLKSEKTKNVAVEKPDSDPIMEKLLSLYEGKVGNAFSKEDLEEEEKKGKERYSKNIPPGYKDSNKQKADNLNNVYGDYILWRQILNYAKSEKKDIILITNDQKEDWWYIEQGKTLGPRIELRKEFFDETGQRFHMYTMSNFIEMFESGNDTAVDKNTIDEIEFFSNVLYKKTPRSELKEYYDSFDSEIEARKAKIRYEIMRLERKNNKRWNTIICNKKKYDNKQMPENIIGQIQGCEMNIAYDNERIRRLKQKILDLDMGMI